MSFQVTHVKEKKGEDDSMTWKAYAVEKLGDLQHAIQDMVQQEDELPNQLFEMANAILKTLPDLNVISLRLYPSVRMNNTFPLSH